MQSESLSPFNIPTNDKLRWLAAAGEKVLGLNILDTYYREKPELLNCQEFIRHSLEVMGVNYSVCSGALESIPETGSSVVVANHPFGGIEGIVLAELLLGVRSDVKIMANNFLLRIPELKELLIGVDVFDSSGAAKRNITPIKQAVSHVKNGGLLMVFPAGEVSSSKFPGSPVIDKEWNRVIGMLVRKTQSSVTSIYIEGCNSRLFNIAGMIHPRIRTLMLAREMLKKQNTEIKFHIGKQIAFTEMRAMNSDRLITQYIRLNTDLMANRYKNKQKIINQSLFSEIPEGVSDDALFDNVMKLKTEQLLLQSSEFDVYCADAKEIPEVLDEIGRLREISFRDVGEGTGKSRDLDKYDEYYQHLFIWDRINRCLVGAYRLGLVDEIILVSKLKGLYSRSLFGFNKKFIKSLGCSIEMGRSFIRPEYQRNKNSLSLLWKGIATYIYQNPKYTTLFGPVSISNEYSEVSRALMTNFLKVHHYDDIRAGDVKATNPHKKPRNIFWTQNIISMLSDNKTISKLVERLEGDKGLPILIKQYLGLNGRLVSFNVDKNFNDVLDGLIVVDLREVPEKSLARYMGKDKAAEYLRHHIVVKKAA